MRYWVDCSVDIHYPQFVFEIECDCCGKHFEDEHDVCQVGDKDYCWECWDRMEEEKDGNEQTTSNKNNITDDKRRRGVFI